MKVLVVEDDNALRRSLVSLLEEENYAVDQAGDGSEGLYKARSDTYDAVVLDVMLPGMDGWAFLAELRKAGTCPVLMLTARTGVHDRVQGLDLGADDYLSKPFDNDELLARLRAIIRRRAGHSHPVLKVGILTLDTATRRIYLRGDEITATAREYALLEFLVMHRGKIVSRSDLYEHLFDEDEDSASNLLDVHVSNLRKKIGPGLIETRRGHGYIIG
jgi:two-component system, OmpR family, response regulator